MKSKMKYLFVILFLISSNPVCSQISISDFVVNPVEKKYKVVFKFDNNKTYKKFKYFINIEDNNKILSYFSLNESDIKSYLGIVGQTEVFNREEADVVYSYTFNSVDVMDQEVYDTGTVLSTGGYSRSYYRARGTYKFDVCYKITYPSKPNYESNCNQVYDLDDLKIETDRVLDPNEAAALWNKGSMREVVADEVIKKIKANFNSLTGEYAVVTEHGAEIFVSRFKLKDNKKHKRGTSDEFLDEFEKLLFYYNYDYHNYFLGNCYKVDSLKYSPKNCINTLRTKIIERKKRVKEGISFWKDELTNKYYKKGKKSEIKRTMALNLFSSSIFLNDIESAEFALKILKEEKYGHAYNTYTGYNNMSTHEDMQKLLEVLKLKSYKFIPKYYSYYSKVGENTITRGSDFPVE